MRCKVHPYESGVGVCAVCLRERLLCLAAERNGEAAAASEMVYLSPPPALPAFPRSVSPYVAPRRRSDATAPSYRQPRLLFFHTPQVGPSAANEEGLIGAADHKQRRPGSSGKFSVFGILFGRSNGDSNKGSWFSGIMSRGRFRRRRKEAPAPLSPTMAEVPVTERGLSPDRRDSDDGEGGGYGAESSPWRPTPSPMQRRVSHHRRAGGLGVCLSPLVRPSPGHRRGHGPDLVGFSGEIIPGRSPQYIRRHGSSACDATLSHCRSRKLADVGRFA